MNPIKITWLDSARQYGWFNTADLDMDPLIVESVGYLIEENEEVYCISTSVAGNTVIDPLTIPKCSVVKVDME